MTTLNRAKYRALRNMTRAIARGDFDAALRALDVAEKIRPPNPTTLNARGAIAVERREIEKGRKLFEEALKLDPKFFPAKFNQCEIAFVQKKWAEAREQFIKLKAEFPDDELTQFRIYLTYLMEGNEGEAKRLLDAVPFLSDTPIFYYSNAAWEFAHKRSSEALEWIKRGQRVFSHAPEKMQAFNDVFYDLGWLQRPKPGEGVPILTRGPVLESAPVPDDAIKLELTPGSTRPVPSAKGSLPQELK